MPEILTLEYFKVDAALKKAVAAAKSRGFDPEVELSPQQYAAHMRRWSLASDIEATYSQVD